MMFPSAVNGQMPFVEKYKQEQIRKVIEKHRARHHSGPDSRTSKNKSSKQRDTHSMPILWQSVYAGGQPPFLSMPSLRDSRSSVSAVGLARHHSRVSNCSSSTEAESSHKHSLLSSLKKLFSHKKNSKSHSSGATVQSTSSASKNRKEVDNDIIAMGGGRSAKRQRMRTISNLSGVMETIEEVNEVLGSTDYLPDSDSSSSYSGDTHYSAPELNSTNTLLYSCSNLSSFSGSSSSQHSSTPDVICVA